MSKQKGFAALLFTIVLMALVGIVAFSMVFISLYEYKSIENYSDYERAYYLALGAYEEAVSLLTRSQENNTISPWIETDSGQYKYEISDIGSSRKNILFKGKVNNIQRVFQCTLQLPPVKMDIKHLINYSIYCSGSLFIHDLGKIKSKDLSHPATIGIIGDMTVEHSTGSAIPLDVIGNIELRNTNAYTFLANCPQLDTNMPLCSKYDPREYIDWLKDSFTDRVYIMKEGFSVLDSLTDPSQEGVWDVCIVENRENIVVRDLNFEGILLFNNIQNIEIESSAHIKGLIMVFGSKTKNIYMGGNIHGALSVLSNTKQANVHGCILYDYTSLKSIEDFLAYEQINKSTNNDAIMIKWKELE